MRIAKLFPIWAASLALLFLLAPLGLRAQNMSSYITLTVKQGAEIKLDFKAPAENTPIRVVSGTTSDITVSTDWTGSQTFTAGAETMIVYGDLKEFDCSGNGENITGLVATGCTKLTILYCYENQLKTLDVSGCTALKTVYCDNNNLSTEAYNQLFCSLPEVTHGELYLCLYSSPAEDHAKIAAADGQNAIDKGWEPLAYGGVGCVGPAASISFTGSYECPVLNMDSYITLTVKQGAVIRMGLEASAENTLIRVVSGSSTQNFTVGTSMTRKTITAAGETMTVYGDLRRFVCYENRENITGLATSGCEALEYLLCEKNQLSTLDVSGCPALILLNCGFNQLSTLDASGCKALEKLQCYFNQLQTLDVSGCTALGELNCNKNQLTALDVSGCPALTVLQCLANLLPTLDLSASAALTGLYCSDNLFETLDLSACAALTDLYCINNQLTSLDLSACAALTDLYCFNNQLTSLDLSASAALGRLYCSDNLLETLDLSACAALERLSCAHNNLSTEAYDALFCSLPDRTGKDAGTIYALDSKGDFATNPDSNTPSVKASDGRNAISKNWEVMDYNGDGINTQTLAESDFSGSYTCPSIPVNYDASPEHGKLKVQDQNGRPIANGAMVYEGDKLTITGTPDEGYQLKEIKADAQTFAASPAEYTVPAGATEVNISAKFEVLPKATVNIAAPEHGALTVTYKKDGESVEVNNGDAVYVGTLLAIAATPADGYKLEEIKADDQSYTESPAEYRIRGSATEVNISATFAEGSEDDENTAVESELLAGVAVGPNPFGAILQVQHAEAVKRYTLRNALGQSVLSGNHRGENRLQLHTAHLPSGLYLLVLHAEDGVRTLKVVKQ